MTVRIRRTVLEDGTIQDDPVDLETLEKLAGKKLDRRRSYALIENVLCVLNSYVVGCSGCLLEGCDYDSGIGCSECGHTGRRKESFWTPEHLT